MVRVSLNLSARAAKSSFIIVGTIYGMHVIAITCHCFCHSQIGRKAFVQLTFQGVICENKRQTNYNYHLPRLYIDSLLWLVEREYKMSVLAKRFGNQCKLVLDLMQWQYPLVIILTMDAKYWMDKNKFLINSNSNMYKTMPVRVRSVITSKRVLINLQSRKKSLHMD